MLKSVLKILLFVAIIILIILPAILIARGRITVNYGQKTNLSKKFDIDFEKVKIDLKANVEILPGEENKVEIEGGENFLKQIVINGSSRTLEIMKNDAWRLDLGWADSDNVQTKIKITLRKLQEIDISSEAKVTLNNFKIPNLTVTKSGSGFFRTVQFQTDYLKIENKGSGLLDFNGRGQSLELISSGSGRSNFKEFPLKMATVNISGSGNVDVRVSDKLAVKLTGSGNLIYSGNPKIERNITGSGKIIQS